MEVWIIQKVGIAEDGRIDRVQWQQANVKRSQYFGPVKTSPAQEVLAELRGGGKVLAVLTVNNRILSNLKVVEVPHPKGGADLEVENPANVPGATLKSLPRL